MIPHQVDDVYGNHKIYRSQYNNGYDKTQNNNQVEWAGWSKTQCLYTIDTKIEGFSIIDILSSEESTIQRKLQFKSHLSNLDAEQTQK